MLQNTILWFGLLYYQVSNGTSKSLSYQVYFGSRVSLDQYKYSHTPENIWQMLFLEWYLWWSRNTCILTFILIMKNFRVSFSLVSMRIHIQINTYLSYTHVLYMCVYLHIYVCGCRCVYTQMLVREKVHIYYSLL